MTHYPKEQVEALVSAANAQRNCNRNDFDVTFTEACKMHDDALANLKPQPAVSGDMVEDSYDISCPEIPSLGVAKEIMREWFPDPIARKSAIHMVQLLQFNAVKTLAALPPVQPIGEAVLPHEVDVGGVKFGKGVKLQTLVNAAARWKQQATGALLAHSKPAGSE